MSKILEATEVTKNVREGNRIEFLKTTLAGYFKQPTVEEERKLRKNLAHERSLT